MAFLGLYETNDGALDDFIQRRGRLGCEKFGRKLADAIEDEGISGLQFRFCNQLEEQIICRNRGRGIFLWLFLLSLNLLIGCFTG